MGGRSIYILPIIILPFLHEVYTTNREFSCGVIGGNLEEYDAMYFAVNKTTSLNNISIVLQAFDGLHKIQDSTSVFVLQNFIALIEGGHTKTSACALSTVTGIPLIRLHGDSRSCDQCGKLVQLSAGYKDYAHASLDILNTFRWKRVALVIDEARLQEAWYFHVISQSLKRTVNFVQISEQGKTEDPTASVLRAIKQIRELQPEAVLLYTNKENIELILQQEPCRQNRTWILQGQVPLNLTCHPSNIVLAMKLPFIESSTVEELEKAVGNYNDANKEFVLLAFDAIQVINQALNREPCSLINGINIVNTSKDTDAMLSCMREVNLNGVTGPIQFSNEGERIGVDLDILNLHNNSFTKIGHWNSTQGAMLFKTISRNMEALPSTSLMGRKFRVVVVESAPFLARIKDKDCTVLKYKGYCIDLLNELTRILKFTYDIYLTPDGKYGVERENKTWNGMIGELANKRADLIVADLTITESRVKVVDFTVPYMYYTERILMKKASSNNGGIDLLRFMSPFNSNVWYATLASLVVISVAVYVVNYFSPYGYKDENGQGTSEEFSYFNSLWFALACMLQQGPEHQPRSLSVRILVGCYWFCILISISTYTANLAAFLTVKNAELPIHNIEDVVRSTYQVGVIESSSTYEAFKASKYETNIKIWHRMHSAGTFAPTGSQGIQWVRERNDYLFITDGPTVRHAANQPPCDLTTVPGLTTAKGLALALQANDPHTDDFTQAILHLHENYFLDNLRRKWWENPNGCPEEQQITHLSRIDLSSMFGVYVVLGVGIVLAFLTLFAEIFWKRKKKWAYKTRRLEIGSVPGCN